MGFRYELGIDTLDVTIVWAQTWLNLETVTIYDLGEDQDLSKDGLDKLCQGTEKDKPAVKSYAQMDTPTTKKGDREYAYRFPTKTDFQRAGLIISARFKRNDTAPGLTHYYTAVMAISVTAVPALHCFLGDSYWFSVMQDDDATRPSGKKYLIYSENNAAANSYLVSRPDGTMASLMNADNATELGDDDLSFFGMLAPFSIFRQMATGTKVLGEQFLEGEFTALANAGSLSGMEAFHGSSLVLFSWAWRGIQGNLPLADNGLGRAKAGLTTFLDSSKDPLDRLYGLGSVVYAVGETLLALFPEAVASVAGKLVSTAVKVTAAELKSALKVTVEALSEQTKVLIQLLEDLKAAAATLANAIDKNIADLKALIGQVESEVVTLGPKIDAIPATQMTNRWALWGRLGSASWNAEVKASVEFLKTEATAGRMEKLAEKHFRTKGAKLAIVDPVQGAKVGVGTEEAFEQTIWFKDVDQPAVLDAINNSNLTAAEKQDLRAFAKERFAKGKCCRIDHIRIDHSNRMIQVVDRTGSWNFEHRTKTDFYKFVFENCLKNSSNSFGGIQYSKLGYVVRAIEYFWLQ